MPPWAKSVEFDLIEQIKKRFDEAAIEIPYAYQNVVLSGGLSASVAQPDGTDTGKTAAD